MPSLRGTVRANRVSSFCYFSGDSADVSIDDTIMKHKQNRSGYDGSCVVVIVR